MSYQRFADPNNIFNWNRDGFWQGEDAAEIWLQSSLIFISTNFRPKFSPLESMNISLDEDQDDDDNHVMYLLIGLSTDFGSGSDKVTGPKALKPQGLLVRGLTCIS